MLDACLVSYPVQLADGGYRFNLPDTGNSDYSGGGFWYNIDLKMPDIECARCVLRWRYHAGNNWGCNSPNDCGIGKGYQEEFVNCADIQIYKGDSTPSPATPTAQSTVSTTLAENAKCAPWQEQYPYAVLDFSDLTTEKNPTGCTEEPNGHLGERNSICYLTCPAGYKFVWDDPSRPEWKTRASVTCKGTGKWEVNAGFSCQNPCPELFPLNKKKFVIVKHEWETGFELMIKFTPTVDVNDWTVIFGFLEEPGVTVQFYAWEAQLT